jgi:NAD(P)H-hydrate epimerase
VIPVVGAKEMRAADAAAIRAGTPSLDLMEAAATALVEETRAMFPEWREVAVVCGPGNNGGDGLAAARLLREEGLDVRLFCLGDPSGYRGDPAENLARAEDAGLDPISLARSGGFARLASALTECDGVIDALFGTGLSRALTGGARRAVQAIAKSGKPVVAADVPSGLSSDSGALPGPAVRAVATVAFAAAKLCHVLPPARAMCGRVLLRDIGIDVRSRPRPESRRIDFVEAADVRALLPARAADSNKGDYGRLAVVAGSRGKAGAAVLAARGAIRAGAGLVTVFCPAAIESIPVSVLPEAMTSGLPDDGRALAGPAAAELSRELRAGRFDAAVVGPGLSTAKGVIETLRSLLRTSLPLVCDADALNAFRGDPSAFRRRAPTVLTPHPGEAGRLLGTSASAVQRDRLGAARQLARESRAVVVLKGDGTLIAAPSGRVAVNPTGTPLLATGGTGDVLAGAIGALLAGGLEPFDAAFAAVWLHGRAGELLGEDLGDAGLLARELADALPRARHSLRVPTE